MTEHTSKEFSIKIIDGIVHAIWLKEWLDYDVVDAGIKTRLSITVNKSYPMLSDISRIKGGTREARIRLAGSDGLIGLNALAVIYKDRMQFFLLKLFGVFYNPPIPTMYFKNKSKAVDWLEQFK